MSRKPEKRSGIPTSEEITAAVEMAGYPLEIRVYEQLQAAGVIATFGQRYPITAESIETREVDLLASFCRYFGNLGEATGYADVIVEAFIQLKRVHDGGFVGFVGGRRPNEDELRAERASIVAGIPSVGVLQDPEYEEGAYTLTSKHGLAGALDILNVGPYCVQWGIARRIDKLGGEVRIDQEHSAWEDMANTIKAIRSSAQSYTSRLLSADGSALVSLAFRYPALVVDAPLWTYEVSTKALSSVESFIVRVAVDTSWGPVTMLVDVVSANHLDPFIERYKQALNNLEQRIHVCASDLFEAARKMRTHHFNKVSDALAARYSPVGSAPYE